MRTTVRIDDDPLRHLKEQARKEDTSLTRLLNQTVLAETTPSERAYTMGRHRIKLDKALSH
jgi:hypothetical protein